MPLSIMIELCSLCPTLLIAVSFAPETRTSFLLMLRL